MVDTVALLAAELTADDLVRGYSAMSDQAAADDLNTAYRDAPASMADLFDYLIENRAHTNTGTDTTVANQTPSTILGRLIMAAEQSAIDADPFGAGGAKVLNSRELHSAKAFLFMLKEGLAGNVDFTDTIQGDILNDLINGGVMNAVNRTAIIALSQAKQSRAQELELGVVAVAHVTAARAA